MSEKLNILHKLKLTTWVIETKSHFRFNINKLILSINFHQFV